MVNTGGRNYLIQLLLVASFSTAMHASELDPARQTTLDGIIAHYEELKNSELAKLKAARPGESVARYEIAQRNLTGYCDAMITAWKDMAAGDHRQTNPVTGFMLHESLQETLRLKKAGFPDQATFWNHRADVIIWMMGEANLVFDHHPPKFYR